MLGAISGDVIGSIYEVNNIKNKQFELFDQKCTFTDDTVMTCAIALSCIKYLENKNKIVFKKNIVQNMQLLGRMYPNAGYGGTFIKWIFSNTPVPYNSYGNGSAMRVSPIAWISNDLNEVEELAEISASVSHNHEEGIKGAKAIASVIWMARNGFDKNEIQKYIEEKYYNLNFKIDDIRKYYKFDVSCQGSVPQAIKCFLESESYEDCIRNAVSLGGDSDTIAAMSGSIAEAFYGIPKYIELKTKEFLDDDLQKIINKFYICINKLDNENVIEDDIEKGGKMR